MIWDFYIFLISYSWTPSSGKQQNFSYLFLGLLQYIYMYIMVLELLNRLSWTLRISLHVSFKDEDFVVFSWCLTPPHLTGAKPFECPQCDKLFRTSAHRKSHIQSHFKELQEDADGTSKKRAFKRISHKSGDLPDIPLQEPILITDTGKSTYTSMYICMCMHPTCLIFCTLLFSWSFTVHDFSPLAQSVIPWMYNLPIKMQSFLKKTFFKIEFRF